MPDRYATVTTWTAADQTIGAGAIVFVNALGGDAASTLTVLDGTDIKLVINVAATANVLHAFQVPTALANIIIDETGTAGYSVGYVPTT